MKILIGILVIVLAVFLYSVELGTPLGAAGLGAAPEPVPVPSARRQTGRGGRYGRQQSGSTPQPAAKFTQTPEIPTPSFETLLGLNASQEAVPRGIYMEHPRRGFIKITEGQDVVLFKFRRILIGILADEDILPIFNKRHEIIRIDYNQNGLRIPMNETEAHLWGVFGKYAQFMRQLPPAFV